MAKHQDVIFFVRDVETPEKSFITCRYNVAQKGIVEARYKNNKDCEYEMYYRLNNRVAPVITEIINSL